MRHLLFALVLFGCDSKSSNNNADLARLPDLAGPLSRCGHPGDTGNSKGVGQYCKSLSMCTGAANICSALGNGTMPSDGDTYFCTIYPCVPPDGGANETDCGENATCVCEKSPNGQNGCACAPDNC